MKSMLGQLSRVALPAIVTMWFSVLMKVVSMLFLGNTNDSAKIAGIGLSNMYTNVVCQSLMLGLNGGIATLAAQAYGAKNLRKCGIYLNRGRLIVLIAFAPMAVALLNCENFLILIN